MTVGFLGDTSGLGWGARRWRIGPAVRWFPVRVSLTATSSAERLAVWPKAGAERIDVDGLLLTKRGAATPRARQSRRPPRRAGSRSSTTSATFSATTPPTPPAPTSTGGSPTGATSSVRRPTSPYAGFGFGKPAAFRWHGILYDARKDVAADPNDVTPPHN